MKRLLITVVLATFTLMAQAQWAVGGQFGFNSVAVTERVSDGEDIRDPRETDFTIAPLIARKVGERTILGIHPEFGQRRLTIFGTDDNTVFTGTRGGASVFALYTYFSFGRVNLLAKPRAGFTIENYRGRIGSGDRDLLGRTTVFNVAIAPVIDFHINERIMLIATLNFMELGFRSTHSRDVVNGELSDDRLVENRFGFNFDSVRGGVAHFGGDEFLRVGFLIKL